MKILLILITSLLLAACATTLFPVIPEIKDHYVTEVREDLLPKEQREYYRSYLEDFKAEYVINAEEIPKAMTEAARCLHFNVLSMVPYKIEFTDVRPLQECHMVGGYTPENVKRLANWSSDVVKWAETRKKCFK